MLTCVIGLGWMDAMTPKSSHTRSRMYLNGKRGKSIKGVVEGDSRWVVQCGLVLMKMKKVISSLRNVLLDYTSVRFDYSMPVLPFHAPLNVMQCRKSSRMLRPIRYNPSPAHPYVITA